MGPNFSRGSGGRKAPSGVQGQRPGEGSWSRPGERSSPAEIRFKHFACA